MQQAGARMSCRLFYSSQLNPSAAGEDLNPGDRVNFPKPTSCLANLVGMVRIEHQPSRNPDFGALLGKAAEGL
jgi:hypothetical protein